MAPGSCVPIPLYVRLAMTRIRGKLKGRRHYPALRFRTASDPAFRVDAKAEGQLIRLGGWRPTRDSAGALDTRLSPWYVVELDEEKAPWAYCRGVPYRMIGARVGGGGLPTKSLLCRSGEWPYQPQM